MAGSGTARIRDGVTRRQRRAEGGHTMTPGDGIPGAGAADDPLLTPSEVAEMFRVNPKTVTRWARTGRLQAIKTIGGHRRYRLSEVRKAVEAANGPD